MPKMKTHKGLKKRVKVTKNKKYKYKKAFKAHKLTKKSGDRKRSLRSSGVIAKADQKTMEKLLPYE
ncbi:MAG: 50S ribosomal protein L35 [Halanaerobium sp.]|nr:50S ribosomal protein L35 [Halanaerobium sp.]